VSESEFGSNRDKTRLCPTCRMEISVLATRCRYCGDEVGRPKDAQRQLTMEELGGETTTHYAPSSNVMEALEAFRSEIDSEEVEPEPQKRSLFGRKKGQPEEDRQPDEAALEGLPNLDAGSQALASLYVPTTRRTTTAYRAQKPTWMRKIGWFGGFVAAAVVLSFGAIRVAAIIRDAGKEVDTGPKVVNRAPGLLKQKGKEIPALEAAQEANRLDPNADNSRILQRARTNILNEIDALLNKQTWTRDDLDTANNMASKAVAISGGAELKGIAAEVDQEVRFYNRTKVTRISGDKTTILLWDGKQVDVGVGDTLYERFKVTGIRSAEVVVEDSLRKARLGRARRLRLSQTSMGMRPIR
jgi:ribosomal protein L40E